MLAVDANRMFFWRSIVTRIKALVVLGGIFVVMPVLLFFGLRWLARRWIRTRPSSQLATEITPAGYALYSCQVLFLLECVAAYQLDPTGPFGAFLHTPVGVVVSLLGVLLVLFLAAASLNHLGYPPMRDKSQRDKGS
jgi:hypothetical protein